MESLNFVYKITLRYACLATSFFCLLLICVSLYYRPDFTGGLFKIFKDVGRSRGFSFAGYFGDHMVLQRAPARAVVWGYGDKLGAKIQGNLTCRGTMLQTFNTQVVSANGSLLWRVHLNPVQAGGPCNLTFTSLGQQLTMTDVLFGDVWLCSGQSNMAFTMETVDDPEKDIQDSVHYEYIRIFNTLRNISDKPLIDIMGVRQAWTQSTPESITHFSAVCWYYGRNLYRKLKVPIGLLETAWGGTRIEVWTSQEVINTCYGITTVPKPVVRVEVNKEVMGYNAMIHPFHTLPIFGVIWYQGEENRLYDLRPFSCLFKNMIEDWREKWFQATNGQTNRHFPFGIVQLASHHFNYFDDGIPEIRWVQSGSTGKLPNKEFINCFMAVAMDLPDAQSKRNSIHPRHKRQVADRLALAGLAVAYGQTDVGRFQGPVPTDYKLVQENGERFVEITMDDGRVELLVKSYAAFGFEVRCTWQNYTNNTWVHEWSIAPTRKVVQGKVTIDVLCHYLDSNITGVRYAWRTTPVFRLLEGHLYSVENNLPAPPFIFIGEIT